MKAKLRPLCISLWTPPIVRPQAVLMAKMMPEWKRQGVFPVIVTYDICGDWKIGLDTYKIPRYAPPTGFVGIIPGIKLITHFIYYFKQARRIADIANRHNLNVIYSFANPPESNLMAVFSKNWLKIPVISHFSDPWADNDLKKRSSAEKRKIRLLERFVVKKSDVITTVAQDMKEYIMNKYPQSWQKKCIVVNHCFDPSLYPTSTRTNDGKFVISHIGIFYKKRTPEALLRAIQSLITNHPQTKSKLEVRLVGAIGTYTDYKKADLDKMIDSYNLNGIVKILPPVPFMESLKEMVESDCLVAIDPTFRYFIACKAIDYAGSQRPIVGIAPDNASTAIFIRSLGYTSFPHDRHEEISEELYKQMNGDKIVVNDRFLQQYNVSSTTHALLDIIAGVLIKP